MREFRAWDKHEKKMIYKDDVDISENSLLAISLHCLPIAIDRDSIKKSEIVGWNVDHRFVLMQSTAFKDKNSTEIFEGDIIFAENDKHYLVAETLYSQPYQSIIGLYHPEYGLWSGDGDVRVVGNIYENSELLELSND